MNNVNEQNGKLQLIDVKKIRTAHEKQFFVAQRPERLPNLVIHKNCSASTEPSWNNHSLPQKTKKSRPQSNNRNNKEHGEIGD